MKTNDERFKNILNALQIIKNEKPKKTSIKNIKNKGTTITRASLSNLNIMKKLGIEVGKTVSIAKKGLIIPQVLAVLD